MLYLIIKWVHVLAAIAALGSNITYGVWLARASREPGVLPFVLRSVKFIDDRIANPAYVLLLVTGFGMAGLAQYPLSTPWIASALALFVVMVALGLFGYTPTLKAQIHELERGGAGSTAYRALAVRGRVFGAILGAVVVTIVFLMVVKPALWG